MSDPRKETEQLVPWSEAVRMIAREAARSVIKEHMELCEARKAVPELEKRMTAQEVTTGKVIGYIMAAATIGGGTGLGLSKLIGGQW